VEEWSVGVLEEWDRIGARVLKVRTTPPTPSSRELLWKLSAPMYGNTPIIQFSNSPLEKTMIGRANGSDHAQRTRFSEMNQ
jgi:hypothetical protein